MIYYIILLMINIIIGKRKFSGILCFETFFLKVKIWLLTFCPTFIKKDFWPITKLLMLHPKPNVLSLTNGVCICFKDSESR